jgi:CDP-glycerol glycerophosphotransferase
MSLSTLPAASSTLPAGLLSAVGAGDELRSLQERVAEMEAFGGHVSSAIDSLVTAVLEVKAAQEKVAPPPDLTGLQTRVKDLEQQLLVERSNRDFAAVSRMHPKTRSVVFVGTTFFGDNVKYTWLAFREKAAALGIACWWLPQNREQQQLVEGLGGDCFPPAYTDWTPEHIHLALSAACVVLTDHFLNPNPFAAALMAGARQVQLWHGLSIKEIGFRNLPNGRALGPHLARVLNTCGNFASFVGTQASNEADWRRWLAFERYAPIGYSRNDVLHREPNAGDLANVDLSAYELARHTRSAGRRVFVYAPTFRDGDRGRWIQAAGLQMIASRVQAAGDCLLVNLHPVEAPHAPELARAMPEVRFVQPRTDIYPLLAQSSALITDYSSLIFDYLHLDRPIVLYRPDHASYIERSRKLFDQRLAELPGPVCEDAESLVNRLNNRSKADRFADARRRMAGATFDQLDGQAADRAVNLIAEEVDRAVSAAR